MRAVRCVLCGVVLTALCTAAVHGDYAEVNPCRQVTVQCRAGEKFLDVVYLLQLGNPGDHPAVVQILPSVDVLESVEGIRKDLVLSRTQGGLRASIPAGWEGRLALGVKQRITTRPATGASAATVPLPPALSREIEFEVPAPRVELKVEPECIVRPLDTQGDRSAFRLLPLRGEVLTLEWRQLPPARRVAYSLDQVHRIAERAPGFHDEVILDLIFPDAAPDTVALELPPGISVTEIVASDQAVWSIREGRLQVQTSPNLAGARLSLTCQLTGATELAEDGTTQLLHVPLFTSPGADRHTGRVLVGGDLHELDFAVLKDAARAAAGDEQWRLACDLRGPGAEIVVSIVPMETPAHATVESFYRVSAFNVEGQHRISIGDNLPSITSLEVILPPGHVARTVSCPFSINWSQDGRSVRVKPLASISGGMSAYITTECLTGGKAEVKLSPPLVPGVASSEYALGLTPAENIQLKTGGPAETWRVPPESLPSWLRAKAPAIGYRYPDTVVPVEVEIARLQAEIRGNVQEHVTVLEDRIRRESLFLLEVSRRPVSELILDLAPGLTVERVGGPAIESWEVSEDGAQLTVRFTSPVPGACHFLLVTSRPVEIGNVKLRGIRLRDAPQLKGWLGVSWDVSVEVRPFEDGRLNLGSVRTDRAPDYLKGFENRLLYEFYDSRWELDLITAAVPPVYSAEVLNVLRFRAAQADASALFNIHVTQGGVTELDFELPRNATSPQLEAPDLVLSQLKGRNWHVRLRGKRTGSFTCRVDYSIVAGAGETQLTVQPVRLLGAKEQTGVLLLAQARPDAGVKVGSVPRQLQPAEPESRYLAWEYDVADPALAAFTYRGADWELPLVLTSHPLSEVMLRASIPLAKLDTLVQRGEESIHHLRLYVSNTSKQFLTLDLEKLGRGARLIGTYVYGEPVKPFREGDTKLQLPLFTSEKAANTRMWLDITYATPHRGLAPFRKQSLVPPDLGLNVGQLEWTVRVPEGCRLAAVGGNMGKPVSEVVVAASVAGRLTHVIGRFLEEYGGSIIGVAVAVLVLGGLIYLMSLLARHGLLRKVLRPTVAGVVVLLVIALLAFMLMPALSRAGGRESAGRAGAAQTLHSFGVDIDDYRSDKGHFPPSIDELISERYVGEPEDLESEDWQLVYELPAEDASNQTAIAYYWRRSGAGAYVLFRDGAIEWVEPNEVGSLVNPRDGTLIAAGAPRARPAAKKEFAGTELAAGELQQAFELEQQMAPRQVQRGVERKTRGRAELLDEAFAKANTEKIESALKRYGLDHEGKLPESKEDLAPYLPDERLRRAVVGFRPALTTAGKEVRVPEVGLPEAEVDKDQLAQARYNLGIAYLDRGQYEQAEENFRRALDLKPDYDQARRQLDQTGALRGATAGRQAQAGPVGPPAERSYLPSAVYTRPPPGVPVGGAAGFQVADDLSVLAERLDGQEELARIAERAVKGVPAAIQAPEEPVAIPQELPRRIGKASLVKRLGGGRSVGALPIAIKFPVPDTADYQFVKPFLGRAEAELSFRPLSRRAAMLIELMLATLALIAYVAIRSRWPASAVPFGGIVLAAALVLLLASPASVATLFASTVLAMGACLAAELLGLSAQAIRRLKAKES